MGSRMARNLMHGGHDLLVYDSSSTRLRDFCKDTGAASASSPSGMAAEAGAGRSHRCSVSTSAKLCELLRMTSGDVTCTGVIFTMLPSSKHVRDVYCGNRGILSTEGGRQPLPLPSYLRAPVGADM